MKPVFCSKCHKRIMPPKFLQSSMANIQGNIKLKCSDPKCKGETVIKPNKKVEDGDVHSS